MEIKPFSLKLIGLYLMSSVLSTLKASLSSLEHWRAAVGGGSTSGAEKGESEHLPLENLLLPLACLAVFQIKVSSPASKQSRYTMFYPN